ncbi:MAG: ABC transporter ATP-binding protein/permease [Spirochaetales bacterium]|nr:ABC transporter ATP-binding protein/permease [Spirochaetales bacterium]
MRHILSVFGKFGVQGDVRLILFVSALFSVTSLTSLAYPKLYGDFVRNLERGADVSGILSLYFFIILLSFVIQCFFGWLYGKLHFRLDRKLRFGLFQSFKRLPDESIRELGQGYFSNLIDSTLNSLLSVLYPANINKLVGVVRFVFISAILFSLNLFSGVLSVTLCAIYLGAYFVNRKYYSVMFEKAFNSNLETHATMVESLSMNALFRVFPKLSRKNAVSVKQQITETAEASRKVEFFSDTLFSMVPTYVLPATTVFLLVLLSRGYSQNEVALGTIVTIVAYFGQLTSIFAGFDMISQTYLEATESSKIITAFLSKVPDKKSKTLHLQKDFFYCFSGTKIRLDQSRIIQLDDVLIPKDHIVGLVGLSGAGKTTFINTILGHRPHNGSVCVFNNHNDVSEFDFIENILHISQDTYIFNDDLKHNVLMGDDHKISRMESFVKKLGMERLKNRKFGVDGKFISGGEKRIVNILRLLVHITDYDYVIVDELLASMDNVTKARVLDLVNKEIAGKSVLYVSHDMKEIAKTCDSILTVEENGIVKFDAISNARDNSGIFRKLLATQ